MGSKIGAAFGTLPIHARKSEKRLFDVHSPDWPPGAKTQILPINH
jgi:hypothetical protein